MYSSLICNAPRISMVCALYVGPEGKLAVDLLWLPCFIKSYQSSRERFGVCGRVWRVRACVGVCVRTCLCVCVTA